MLSQESIEKLRLILKKDYGKACSLEEAERIGRGLLNFYEALAENELGIGFEKPNKKSATIKSGHN
jgi:hypothetical protein